MFDMENPRHCEVFALFSAQSSKLRSEYVVDCILKAQDKNCMEEIIRRVITEALKEVSFSIPAIEHITKDLQATESISDLPDALLSSLDEI